MTEKQTATPTPTPGGLTAADLKVLIEAIRTQPAEAITASDLHSLVSSIQAMTPKRKILPSEHKPVSQFNPTGDRNRVLSVNAYQNGRRIEIDTLFDEEIKLLDTLPEGRFLDRMVTVSRTPGGYGKLDSLRIDYNNYTRDQQVEFAKKVRSFVGLLRQIHEEHSATQKAAKAAR